MDPGPWCVASQADLGQQWALSPPVSINFQVSLTVIRYLSMFLSVCLVCHFYCQVRLIFFKVPVGAGIGKEWMLKYR
jgi:hypothetical protein